MPDAYRLARTSCALTALLLPSILVGCAATDTKLSDEASAGYSGGVVSAREYGFVRPATDVAMTSSGRTTSGKHRFFGFSSGSGADLWGEVRNGMQLNRDGNPRVTQAIQRFERDPQYLVRMSQRASPYLHVIVSEIQRRGLPMELALLPQVESHYNPHATSPVAAAGMWQFMPYTGREMGLRQDKWFDERRDILASTRAALDYLELLNKTFNGDWYLTMAAYNCGPACVTSAQEANLRRGKPTDFWSLNLPAETRNYVPQILAVAQLVSNPNRYGLTLPAVPDTPQLQLLRSNKPIDLAQVASATGIDLAELKRLNPGLKYGRTPPNAPGQCVVPAAVAKKASRALAHAELMPAIASNTRPYTQVSVSMPASVPKVAAAPIVIPAVADKPRVTVRATKPKAAPATAATRTKKSSSTHVVASGETLYSIARSNKIDVETLASHNGISPDGVIHPGQKLSLPSSKGTSAAVSYTIRKGDSISGIARRYGVSVKEIQRWNKLADSDITAGETLRIYRRS